MPATVCAVNLEFGHEMLAPVVNWVAEFKLIIWIMALNLLKSILGTELRKQAGKWHVAQLVNLFIGFLSCWYKSR